MVLESSGLSAMAPVASVGWSSVSAVQRTLVGSVAAALVDLQTPPYAPPMYTVLPVASRWSTVTAVTRPVTLP